MIVFYSPPSEGLGEATKTNHYERQIVHFRHHITRR